MPADDTGVMNSKEHPRRRRGVPHGQLSNWLLACVAAAIVVTLLVARAWT
jgi:hypothetical protein